jgi:predicted nucleic acid-binding protein
LIDSWTWIEYWKGDEYSETAASYIEGRGEAIVSAINLTEVHHWILRFYDQRTADQKIETVEKRCFVVPVDRAVALEASKIKMDQGLALADSLILATARLSGAKVVTGDGDFRTIAEAIFIAT